MDARQLLCIRLQSGDSAWTRKLADRGWVVHTASELKTARRWLKEQGYRVGVLMPGEVSGAGCAELDLFLRTHRMAVWVGVFDAAFMVTPCGRDLILDHLFDHHTTPVDVERIAMTLGHAWGHAALRQAACGAEFSGNHPSIIGKSRATTEMLCQARRFARVDAPVLIRGESGSGKELAAQAVHKASPRAQGPFIAVNCAAIQPSLMIAELFGHTKGAFTGASADKCGLVEAANGGTLFLDEIGDLPLELQTTLLRFLQEKTITRVGSTRSLEIDARVIAATHVDLEAAVRNRSFREDLYYRLNVLSLQVPPLRERKDDIESLALSCFDSFSHEMNPRLRGFSRRALAAMEAHDWPGNVRELINRVRRAMVMCEGSLIAPSDLGLEGTVPQAAREEALGDARMQAERGAIVESLRQAGRNVTAAARQLGVSRMTLYRLMAKHGLTPERCDVPSM
jgi:DNA-binding NtrC family response regulator